MIAVPVFFAVACFGVNMSTPARVFWVTGWFVMGLVCIGRNSTR